MSKKDKKYTTRPQFYSSEQFPEEISEFKKMLVIMLMSKVFMN